MSNHHHTAPNLTAARRSYEVCAMSYRDIADCLIGDEPALAEAILRLGARLDELDRGFMERLDVLRCRIDGTEQQGARDQQDGSDDWATGPADQLLDHAVERDGVLGEFEDALADAARRCRPNSAAAKERPVIRFNC
ncbi:hypothetical protein [Glycomyces arizonensis]|uniref:hypothetical protein n=1 Tax=Glycomyces arizonensis TaxID=256035 RepID=UPI0004124D02|nr:hypothetical protein [Glycomyces arizonensis]